MNTLVDKLLQARHRSNIWTGKLSGSALSTAVAMVALYQVDRLKYAREIDRGLSWLLAHVNSDGGWGDTTRSVSNISTTLLVLSALKLNARPGQADSVQENAWQWVTRYCGSHQPDAIAQAVYSRYDNDKTFSAPIMTLCALAGLLGEQGWNYVARLPFELSVCPQKLYGQLGFPVVSYALPALIAIGQVCHHFNPTTNLPHRYLRNLAIAPSLRKLEAIQPANGGFLEASPLTAFVAASLAAKGLANHPVTNKCVSFLLNSQRPDGCWPIDTDLAIWLTTLSINALSHAGRLTDLSPADRLALAEQLLAAQYDTVHPYTLSPPGGWGWTNKPGSVPDADDTAGAVLALVNLVRSGLKLDDKLTTAILAGCRWLTGIQNRDGGLPTFCRGWGKLPFDRSCNDITAHGIAAFAATLDLFPEQRQLHKHMESALLFLRGRQHFDGWWEPLWFGNQLMSADANPVYGTTRVMTALATVPESLAYLARPMLEKATQWLISVQCPSGGFSGGLSNEIVNAQTDPCSIEETALALIALQVSLRHLPVEKQKKTEKLMQAIAAASDYLAARWQAKPDDNAAPIGFYFAKLWYYEELYPLIFSVQSATYK